MWWNVYTSTWCAFHSWVMVIFLIPHCLCACFCMCFFLVCVCVFQHFRVERAQILGENSVVKRKSRECFKYRSTTAVLYGWNSEDVNADGCLDIQSSYAKERADSNLWFFFSTNLEKSFRGSSVSFFLFKATPPILRFLENLTFFSVMSFVSSVFLKHRKDSQSLHTASGPIRTTYQ